MFGVEGQDHQPAPTGFVKQTQDASQKNSFNDTYEKESIRLTLVRRSIIRSSKSCGSTICQYTERTIIVRTTYLELFPRMLAFTNSSPVLDDRV